MSHDRSLFLQEQKEPIAVNRHAADADSRFQVPACIADQQQRHCDYWIRPICA